MSAVTTETLTVTLTVHRAPAQTVVHEFQTINIPADELAIFLETAKMYFNLMVDKPLP